MLSLFKFGYDIGLFILQIIDLLLQLLLSALAMCMAIPPTSKLAMLLLQTVEPILQSSRLLLAGRVFFTQHRIVTIARVEQILYSFPVFNLLLELLLESFLLFLILVLLFFEGSYLIGKPLILAFCISDSLSEVLHTLAQLQLLHLQLLQPPLIRHIP